MTHLAVIQHPSSAASASLHALGGGFVLAIWESNQPDALTRVVPSLGDAEVRPPYTTLGVRTSWGGQRAFSILRAPEAGAGAPLRFTALGQVVAEARVGGGAPDFDAALLLGGLDAPSQLRVVRFFFDFARSAPMLKSDAGFVAACRRLVLELSPEPSALMARAVMAGDLLLYEGTVSAALGDVAGSFIITAEAMGTAPFEAHLGTPSEKRGRTPLHIAVDRALCAPGNLLVLLGRNGLACRRLTGTPSGLPGLLEHLMSREGKPPLPLRHYLLRSLARHARTDASASAAVREVQVLMPLPKRQVADPKHAVGASLDVAVPTGDGGLFLAGWIHDPHGLVTGLRVFTPFGEERRLDAFEYRFPREDVTKLYKDRAGGRNGFVAYLPGRPDPDLALQVNAELRLGSGGSIELIPPPRPLSASEARAAVLGSLPPGFATPEVLERVIAPAVKPLHAAHMARRKAPETVEFGIRPESPSVSVIVPLYRNLEFLRFQLSAFATDPGMADAELLFVLDSPEQRDELEHLLYGFHGLYGLPMTLLVHDANYGYSAANNTGAAVARASRLLFLNSDVIPDGKGWLGRLAVALDEVPGTGAVGPKLLFDDDSLQHAGLYFDRDIRGRWYNHHYYKGMPRDFAPACAPRSVPGVTGACLLTRRAVYEQVGGFCEDYVIGDFEDSDLCLRIRDAGHDIRYVPTIELYHLERRSIRRHQDYTRGVASEFNGWLHAQRWAPAMEELMRRDWEPEAAAPPQAAPAGESDSLADKWLSVAPEFRPILGGSSKRPTWRRSKK